VIENTDYGLADTYPRYLVVPSAMTNEEIQRAAGKHTHTHVLSSSFQHLCSGSASILMLAGAFLAHELFCNSLLY
jgi:hypothetical protein